MNPPTSMTRFIGTPRVATVLYGGCAAAILAWLGGELPWWLGLAALSFVGTVRKAVLGVRRYNQWSAAWAAMGNPPPIARPAAPPKRTVRRREAASPWEGVVLAALSLVRDSRAHRRARSG